MNIYENILLKDDDGRVFKPPGRNRDFPKLFGQLPYPILNRRANDAEFIRSINRSFNSIVWHTADSYTIDLDGESTSIYNLSFRVIYWSFINNIVIDTPWKMKWETVLGRQDIQWEDIWDNVNDNILSYKIQSVLWSMTNLNFISSYRLHIMYNASNLCIQCNLPEEGPSHVFIFCDLSSVVYGHFYPLLRRIINTLLTIGEKAFGLPVEGNE